MKIKVRTIVWFAAAALCLGCIFADTEGESLDWGDATYVKDARVDPKNEGKLVAISGYPEVVENAKDDLIGVSFPSPKVRRYVEEWRWDASHEEWTLDPVYEGKSDDGYENEILVGTVSIGDFLLDEELVSRLSVLERTVMEGDFSDEDLARMESTGSFIRESTCFYYDTGSVRVHWNMWEPDTDDGVTVIGVQKGSTLTYQTLNAVSSVDRIMDEAEFHEEADGSPVNMKYAFGVLALLFVLLGIRSLLKSKRAGKE